MPDPSMDHHTYVYISPHALATPYTFMIIKEKRIGII